MTAVAQVAGHVFLDGRHGLTIVLKICIKYALINLAIVLQMTALATTVIPVAYTALGFLPQIVGPVPQITS